MLRRVSCRHFTALPLKSVQRLNVDSNETKVVCHVEKELLMTYSPSDFKRKQVTDSVTKVKSYVHTIGNHIVPHSLYTRLYYRARGLKHKKIMEETQSEESEIDLNNARHSTAYEIGSCRFGASSLPAFLQDPLQKLFHEYPRALIREDAKAIRESLNSFHHSIIEYGQLLRHERPKPRDNDAPIPLLLEYGSRESMAYTFMQMPFTYAVCRYVMMHTRNLLGQHWQPESLLDFGTGPGTALWAAKECFPFIDSFTGIDVSEHMIECAQKLNQSTDEAPLLANVQFRRFMSFRTQQEPFDVVVASFVLSELLDEPVRRATIDNLWRQTKDVLILIDRGTANGFSLMLEARDRILNLSNGENIQYENVPATKDLSVSGTPFDAVTEVPVGALKGAHIVAPCPHDGKCPLALTKTTCAFKQQIHLSRDHKSLMENPPALGSVNQKFTYMVIRRGPRPETKSNEMVTATNAPWPDKVATLGWDRVIKAPLKRSGHVHLVTCAADEQVTRFVVPRSQGRIVYRDARKAKWGDAWPHVPLTAVQPVTLEELGDALKKTEILNMKNLDQDVEEIDPESDEE